MSISWVVFTVTSPPTTSSIVIGILPTPTIIVNSFSKYSFGLVSSLEWERHPVFSRHIAYPGIRSELDHRGVPQLQQWGLSLWCLVGAYCPGDRTVPCVPVLVQGLSSWCWVGPKVLVIIPVWGQRISAPLECQCLSIQNSAWWLFS